MLYSLEGKTRYKTSNQSQFDTCNYHRNKQKCKYTLFD